MFKKNYLLCLLIFICSCSTNNNNTISVIKKINQEKNVNLIVKPRENISQIRKPDLVRKSDLGDYKGYYKVGRPYVIGGKTYYPQENKNYAKVGIASWYGKQFHLKRTANGELFDMNLFSAAHKTLPMPSIVRVTNLDNNKSIVVRINDRGPYSKNRIIDLSKASANAIGFLKKGTAKVRVEYLGEAKIGVLAFAPKNTDVPANFAHYVGKDSVKKNNKKKQGINNNVNKLSQSVQAFLKDDKNISVNSLGSLDSLDSLDSDVKKLQNDTFQVQLAVFSNALSAKKFAKKVPKSKYFTYVDEISKKKELLFIVKVGTFLNKLHAKKYIEQIKDNGFKDAFVVKTK